MSPAYYNENDPKAAAWLRSLIAAELIPAGTVDERSIVDVRPQDLYGFEQVHFFAGIGGWSLALHLAEWPTGVPVWTGSCPCQPFSAAGKGKGEKDERHLWPEMRRLIEECGPAICFGEQVASKAGRQWLAGVRADLEALGYGVGAADLCAASSGEEGEGWFVYPGNEIRRERTRLSAPHIRQRLFWVAISDGNGRDKRRPQLKRQWGKSTSERTSFFSGLADSRHISQGSGYGGTGELEAAERGESGEHVAENGASCGISDTGGERTQSDQRRGRPGEEPFPSSLGFWSDFDILPFQDGKTRRIEPGTFPLAHGVPGNLVSVWSESNAGEPPEGKFPGRVGLLRGYGNAIVPQVAAKFIEAFLETKESMQ